jgi:hypothetical protein
MHDATHEPNKAYAWLTLVLFAGLAAVVGAALVTSEPERQVAQTDSPLPVEQVKPPITQPSAQ